MGNLRYPQDVPDELLAYKPLKPTLQPILENCIAMVLKAAGRAA